MNTTRLPTEPALSEADGFRSPGDCPPRYSDPNVQHGKADKTTPTVPEAIQNGPALAMSSCPHDDRGGAWPMRAHRPTPFKDSEGEGV